MKAKSFDDLYQEAERHDDYWLAGRTQAFAEEIFVLMERQDVTRSELARRLGTSPAYITKILRGNANFTLASMERLARALGADLRIQLVPTEPTGENVPKRDELRRRSSDDSSSRQRPRRVAAAT